MRDPGAWYAVAGAALALVAGSVLRGLAVLVAVVLCVAGSVVAGAEALAWLWLVIFLPVLVGIVLVGWLLGRLLPRRAVLVPLGVAGAALVVVGVSAAQRAALDRVPPDVAAQLPRYSSTLGAFCIDFVGASDRRSAAAEVRALVRELRRRPDALTVVEYDLADSAGVRREELTVRELAEETLEWAECSSAPARELRAALARA